MDGSNNDFRRVTLRDVIYGAAVGDALGVPYEFCGRDSFECTGMTSGGTHRQPAGTFSDDTSMLLATCDSIRVKHGLIDIDDMRSRFNMWYRAGDYAVDGELFDVGATVATALIEGRGCVGERSNGNGSLMRIAPLAFTGAFDSEICEVSAITHAHEISMGACVTLVHILRDFVYGVPVDEVVDGLVIGDHEFDAGMPRGDVCSGGFVLDTLEASLWCLCNTGSYEECVLAAVNLGDDSDTTGCVAGALAGAVYGYDVIPLEWIDTLRGKDIIEKCLF